MLRNRLRFAAYLLAAAQFFMTMPLVWAGSYDDYFRAIKQDDGAKVLSLLQRGFDPDTPSESGQHGLYLALQEPSPKVAQVLVDWPKTHIDQRNAADETPLMMAALKGQLGLVQRLIERGADVNKPGWAPLHYAATSGHLAVMALLLEHHAFIDAESPNGTTPLMMAAQYGTPQAVRLLLDAGADVNMRNQLGLSAGDFARRASRPDIAAMVDAELARRQAPRRW